MVCFTACVLWLRKRGGEIGLFRQNTLCKRKKVMYKRTIKKELSFAGKPLTRGRHKVHPYPVMLHPLLVDFLIKNFAKKIIIIFDPFCGSGVTLLQAGINNYESFGFDINPLALLITKVKTTTYKVDDLISDFEKSI